MKTSAFFSLATTVLCMSWQTNAMQNSEAKLIDVQVKKDNEYFIPVKDEHAKSGWAIQAKKDMIERDYDLIYVGMFTKTDPKEKFKKVLTYSLCTLLLPDEHWKYYLPKQIIEMIFSVHTNCEFKKGKSPIIANGTVTTDLKYLASTYIPKKPPYQMEVRILRRDHFRAKFNYDNYFFHVTYDIGGDINHK